MEQASVQLFLLPFAGGNATSFQKMTEHLDSFIQTVTVEYSGRGSRLNEGDITDYGIFRNDVVEYIKSHRKKDKPYAIFGYSMGAALAYEIASQNLLGEAPVHLFYGARACIADESLPKLSDEEFIEHAKTMGGFDERVTRNKRLFRLFIHPLKDDYNIAKQFRFEKGELPFCDCTVLYSEKDTPFDTVRKWKRLTTGKTEFFEFGNNHFFVLEHYEEIAKIINQTLMKNIRRAR
ncbi:MAG: thioesterase domain-containing protein [Lachnospiraceae bacterium]|nr:thioesterase domain-containing protein [Lachnospiraceae bacterium]